MSVGKWDHLSRLQTLLLVFLILNNTAKTKLTILAFLYCEEIVKTLCNVSAENMALFVTLHRTLSCNPLGN